MTWRAMVGSTVEPRGVYVFPGQLADGTYSVYARGTDGDVLAFELVPAGEVEAAWLRLATALEVGDPPPIPQTRHLRLLPPSPPSRPSPAVVLALHGRLTRSRRSS